MKIGHLTVDLGAHWPERSSAGKLQTKRGLISITWGPPPWGGYAVHLIAWRPRDWFHFTWAPYGCDEYALTEYDLGFLGSYVSF